MWLPGELYPAEIGDLVEQISRGSTRDPEALFGPEETELLRILPMAVKLVEETPL